jgi:cold shock protein
MPVGKVKFFSKDKGYGFIERDGVEGDVFVHETSVEASGLSTLVKDQRVEFEVVAGSKGDKAVNLRPV